MKKKLAMVDKKRPIQQSVVQLILKRGRKKTYEWNLEKKYFNIIYYI